MPLSEKVRTLRGVEYEPDEETGCWNWLKGKTKLGYGWGHAHRRYWSMANGPIPADHDIHHVCKNPSCVNPDHLEALHKRDHDVHHYLHENGLTLEDVAEIRRLGAEGKLTGRQVARMYGVSWFTIYRYWRGQSWGQEVGAGRVTAMPWPCDRAGCDNLITRRGKRWCSPYCRSMGNRELQRSAA